MVLIMANPNPSPATRFKKGQSGNPSGRSREELENLHKSAKIASEVTLKALSSLQERINESEKITLDDLVLLFSADVRGMIKEAQDRAHGSPKQAVDHTTGGDKLGPSVIERVIVKPEPSDGD